MRNLRFLILVFGIGTARAEPARKFTLTLDEHGLRKGKEMRVVTKMVIDGTKLHYEMTYTGPEADKPKNKPRNEDLVIKNEADVDRALATFDKTAASPAASPDAKQEGSKGCVIRNNKSRCEGFRGDEKSSAGWKALEELAIVLYENIQQPR